MESTILGADERSRQVEYEQFLLLREEVGRHIDDIQMTADAMADLDVLLGLAEGAQQYRYCRPVLDNSMTLRIEMCIRDRSSRPICPSQSAFRALSISCTVRGRNALRTWGRVIVIFAMLPLSVVSYLMSVYSLAVVHCALIRLSLIHICCANQSVSVIQASSGFLKIITGYSLPESPF